MKKKKFKSGTIIKGKNLKGVILCEVLPDDMEINEHTYQMGENIDKIPLNVNVLSGAGLFCYHIKHIFEYLDWGNHLAIIEIPDDEDVYVDDDKFRTHRLIVKEIMSLKEISTWKYLGVHKIDIKSNQNKAIRHTAKEGYLDIVKYLYKRGADITDYNNEAIRLAATYGHLDVVKYLQSNGADINADNNRALVYAAMFGRLNIVQYIYENCSGVSNEIFEEAMLFASYNDKTSIVEYLQQKGIRKGKLCNVQIW